MVQKVFKCSLVVGPRRRGTKRDWPQMRPEKGDVSSQRQPRFERATRSLATFVRSHRSLRSLATQRSASLRSLRSLAPFTGSLTHFAHSLVGQLKFLNMCSRCYRVSRVQTRVSSSLETRPKFWTLKKMEVDDVEHKTASRNAVSDQRLQPTVILVSLT